MKTLLTTILVLTTVTLSFTAQDGLLVYNQKVYTVKDSTFVGVQLSQSEHLGNMMIPDQQREAVFDTAKERVLTNIIQFERAQRNPNVFFEYDLLLYITIFNDTTGTITEHKVLDFSKKFMQELRFQRQRPPVEYLK